MTVLLPALLVLLLLAVPAGALAGDELPQRGVDLGDCAAPPASLPAPRAPAVARAAAKRPGVRRVLARAARANRISAADARAYADLYDRALALRRRLSGLRRDELGAAIDALEDLARERRLTATRIPVLFAQLRVNVDWWSRNGPPVKRVSRTRSSPCAGGDGTGGIRVTDGETVYQWYSGHGLQIQQLGTIGRVNALGRVCLDPSQALRCDPERLRRGLDTIVSLAVDRGGFLAWEYYFAFGGGRPPWISGLSQATAMQALVRGWQVLGDARYLEVARRASGAFRARPPLGVRVPASAGPHFLIYSFNRDLRVFNAFLQALVGLHDYAEAADDDRARALFAAAEREARREVPLSDTGAWSRYSIGGAESDLGYHRLVRDFLRALCERTRRATYCRTAERFTRYLHEFPGVRLADTPAPRARRLTATRLLLTKISCVTLAVSRGGRRVATVSRVLGRGTHALTWVPPRRGAFRVEVVAQDLIGHRTRVHTTVRAR